MERAAARRAVAAATGKAAGAISKRRQIRHTYRPADAKADRMTAPISDRRAGERGFTLLEAIVALALMGLVLAALANITSQWLPNWNRGVGRVQRSETIGVALQRISADLASAEYVSANRETRRPFFDGTELSVTFVRTALGPNSGPGLDIVRVGEARERREFVTVRSRARFAPLPSGASLEQVHFGDPVELLRAPFRLSFAYAGADRVWKSTWRESNKLPAMIRLTVRDAASERVLLVSTIAPLRVQLPSECTQAEGKCTDNKPDTPAAQAPGGQAAGPGQGGTL
jgi:general secretion pathway protein J